MISLTEFVTVKVLKKELKKRTSCWFDITYPIHMIQISIFKEFRAWFYKFELSMDSTIHLIRETFQGLQR